MTPKILREPLVQFLILGTAVFGFFILALGVPESPERIVVKPAQIQLLKERWAESHRHPPTEREMKSLVDSWVMDEILIREAAALGLDAADSLIRNRLLERLENRAEELAGPADPTEIELAAFLRDHPNRFIVDGQIEFEQIFFNVERRGEGAFGGAILARDSLNTVPDTEADAFGDGIPLPSHIAASTSEEIIAMFGEEFLDELAGLPLGVWEGPIESQFGFHLVRLDNFETGPAPELQRVAAAVERSWMSFRKRLALETLFDAFRKDYEVVVDTSRAN